LRRIPRFKVTVMMGKEVKSVAVLKKINQNVAQNVQNRLQITKHLLAAGAPPQTLMNRGAYNILPDSLFQQMLIAPAPEKFSYTYAQYAGRGLPNILSVHLFAACTLSPKVFHPLTPLLMYFVSR